ncbi:MAG: YbfB/YjiJ family MFS transporter [Chloroflexi bacterium]|nr:YbfB/YjiJ family MFS transporter [Chloroflexota bacterium]
MTSRGESHSIHPREPLPASASPDAAPADSAPRWTAAGILAVSASTLAVAASLGLARFGYALLLPDMRAALGVGYTDMGALATANFVGYIVTAFLVSLLAVRFGLRRTVVGALLLTGIATALTGATSSVWMAAALQFFAGLGGAGGVIPSYQIAASHVAPRSRGLASGFTASGAGVGLALSGLVLPPTLALGATGWRWGWGALGLLVVLIALYVAFAVRGDGAARRAGSTRADYVGILRLPAIWWLGVLYVLWGFAYIIFATFFASAAITEGGWDGWTAGQLWSLTGFVAIGSCPLWGALSDRWGRPQMLALVLALQGAACAAVALSQQPTAFVVAAALFAIGGFGVPTLVNAMATDLAGVALTTAAVGVLTLCFGLGQAIGPLVGGALRDLTQSFPAAVLGAAVALLGRSLLYRRPALGG